MYNLDHALICLEIFADDSCANKDSMFRFEPLWFSNDECRMVVQDAWNENVSPNIKGKLVSVLRG